MNYNKPPIVSIVMPAYNAERFVHEAVQSILAQTYTDYELIIVDDGSTDKTWRELQQYAKHPCVRLLRNTQNKRISETLNKGIRAARGEYVARMDSDDVCAPNRLEEEMKFLRSHPEVDLVYTDLYYLDEQGKTLGKRRYRHSRFARTIHIESPIAHATVVFKKELLNKTGLYQSTFDGAEDYDLWFRAYLAGATFGHIAKALYGYRMQPGSTKSRSITKQLRTVIRVKKNAMNSYGWNMSFSGRIRLLIEQVLTYLPNWVSMTIYKIAYIKR